MGFQVQMSLPTDISTAQLATLLGISSQRVNQLAADGVLLKGARNKFNLVASVKAYIEHRETAIERSLGGGDSLTSRRAEWLETKNRLSALDLAERERELVSVAELETAWGTLIDTLRTHLLAIPAKLAPRINAAQSPAQAQAIVRREINDTLGRIAVHEFEATAVSRRWNKIEREVS
jgi:phage terminase Nu1 subunit (DNA packaging protein)